MYYFRFKYPEGKEEYYEHINKVQYIRNGNCITVSGDDIATHSFPTGCDLHLYSDKMNVTVSKTDLRCIIIEKEN